MAPEDLVGKAYALAADKYPRARDQTNTALALGLLAERALGSMPLDLVALASASEDHPAATFSLTFSSSWLSFFVFSPGLLGVRMMSSIRPYSLAASAVRKHPGHRVGHADAVRRDRRADVLHGVVDRESRRDLPARAVDVQRDLFVGILGL